MSDDERREVAARLRSFVTDDSVYADVDACRVLHSIGLYYKDIDRIYFSGFDVARLADLIEPSCDRDTPQKVAEEMFGKMRHSTKEEADAYDAMLKSKSVEIHPVDRDALLALASGLEADADRILRAARNARFGGGPRMGEAKHDAYEWRSIARRIREALGVSDG